MDKFTEAIVEACECYIPKKKNKSALTLPWWSDELAVLKRQVATARRRIRYAAPVRRAKVVEEYLKQKEIYELRAKEAQTSSWKDFCQKQDKEGMWEGIYRVTARTTKRQEDLPLVVDGRVLTPCESAEAFCPDDTTETDNADHQRIRSAADRVNEQDHGEHDPPFTMEELTSVVKSFNPKKAPGQDGLTADICAHAINRDPEFFLSLANKCLALGYFPKAWKEATVVVLRKPGKDDYSKPKSLRPIGLLPMLGKILEKLMIGRIKWHIHPGLSTRQYSFMSQRSTEDALYVLVKHLRSKLELHKLTTVVSLDIEGAFDTLGRQS